MNVPKNPFLITGYYAPAYFCDRKQETKRIQSALSNGRNVTLISVRRLGKSALIEHCFHTFKNRSKTRFIHIDIYATQNLNDFMGVLGKAIFNTSYSKTQKLMSGIIQFFSGIGGSISFDNLTGQPSLEMKYTQPKKAAKGIDDLLDFLENSGQKTFLAIDEFQQIANYPEKNVEALLRTKIQRLKNVQFIFSGSHKHVLTAMFTDYKRPFYQSTEMMYLDKIDEDLYTDFIITNFAAGKKKISRETTHELLSWCRNHTYYVQYLCNRLYAGGDKKIDGNILKATCNEILKENEATFFSYRNLLTYGQWNLLYAIANEEKAVMPTSAKFLKKYDLGGPSSVTRSLQSLIEKEMILQTPEGYLVYDLFFSRWMEQL